MGKLDNFIINFSKPNAIYFDGETITGTVSLRVSERFKIDRISLTLIGGARVVWTESNGKSSTTYQSYEKYMNHVIPLMAKDNFTNQDLYLEFGDYNFKFEFVLPKNLPTSFEHGIGQIRYLLNACIEIPWSLNKKSLRYFTVLNHLDLNTLPALKSPYGVEDQKFFCCGPCRSEPIIATFNTFKTGFVPGETVFFNAMIDNRSTRVVKNLSVSVVQNLSFRATSGMIVKTNFRTSTVATVYHSNNVNEKSVEHWSNGSLKIPAVIASSNGSCKIITVGYALVLKFDAVGGLKKSLRIPITIGTLPYSEGNQYSYDAPPDYSASLYDTGSSAPPLGLLEPQDKKQKTQDETYQSTTEHFTPLYPYYDNFTNLNKIK